MFPLSVVVIYVILNFWCMLDVDRIWMFLNKFPQPAYLFTEFKNIHSQVIPILNRLSATNYFIASQLSKVLARIVT